jgi:hypothetical protein
VESKKVKLEVESRIVVTRTRGEEEMGEMLVEG